MPINAYYQGHGDEVMSSMKKTYGDRAKNVFYATANKNKMTPSQEKGVKKALTKKG